MPELMVSIDDRTAALKDCVWITWAPCGCAVGALTAAWDGEAFATEEQALREIYPTKRERDRYAKQGYRVELMHFDRYLKDVTLAGKCPHLKGDTSQATLDGA